MEEPISAGRMANKLARLQGRLEVDDSERRRIVQICKPRLIERPTRSPANNPPPCPLLRILALKMPRRYLR
jgi:hypothetical protein